MVKQKKPKGRVKGPRREEEIVEREETFDYMSTEELVDSNLLSGVRHYRGIERYHAQVPCVPGIQMEMQEA
jgi:hypothetical protein